MRRPARELELTAVILRVRDFADSHRIIEALSREEGRISLLVRGGRASRRRFSGALDLFVSLHAQCTTGSGLWTLQAADILSARVGIRASLERVERASLLCECAAVLSAEHQAVPDLYAALVHGLDRLDAGDVDGATLVYPPILVAAGIAPSLTACTECHAPSPASVALDAAASGVLCPRCATAGPLVPAELLAAGGMRSPSESEARALETSALTWIEAHIGRPLRSRRVSLRAG